MHELVSQLDDPPKRAEIFAVIRDRWESPDSTWRNIYKALTLYEYFLLHGPERFVEWARGESNHLVNLRHLTNYQYTDSQGKDQGINVQAKAAAIIALLQGKDELGRAREEAATKRARMQLRTRDTNDSMVDGKRPDEHRASKGKCPAADGANETACDYERAPSPPLHADEEFAGFQSAVSPSQATSATANGKGKERASSDLLIDL